MVRTAAVELARADDHTGSLGERSGERPSITARGRSPQVETTTGKLDISAGRPQQGKAELETFSIDLPLDIDMLLVVEGSDGCRLNRTGHHQAPMLANLAQVLHEVDVAGVEAGSATGEPSAAEADAQECLTCLEVDDDEQVTAAVGQIIRCAVARAEATR